MDNFKKEREAARVVRMHAYSLCVLGWAMCATGFVVLMIREPSSTTLWSVLFAVVGFYGASIGFAHFRKYQRIISRLPTDRTR